MNRERDPANPTPEELRETAASEGLMATEEETDPEFEAHDVAEPGAEKRRSPDERVLVGAVRAVEQANALDGPGKALGKAVRNSMGPGALKDALSGTWLGHALHPLLTDIVIGSLVSATLLDVLGGDDDGQAAERLIAVALAAYGPTALSGAHDWADTEVVDPRIRRVGLAHAAANSTAISLYAASLVARRKGAAGRGKLLGLSGAAALAAGGYLGAHMSFVQGVGPNQTAFDAGPGDWADAGESAGLTQGEPRSVVVGDTPVLLLRDGEHLHAIHDRCSHRGCLLSDGEIDGEDVVCACHGSRFRLDDGSVQRGPATAPQPVFETRENGGRVELRLRQPAD
ncbi:MAG: Rieske (2Fe-2S) protein [Actinomycetota bacterium]|nr:Rieske (2Fe-2S) protein [Actinomycetota bacterium]